MVVMVGMVVLVLVVVWVLLVVGAGVGVGGGCVGIGGCHVDLLSSTFAVSSFGSAALFSLKHGFIVRFDADSFRPVLFPFPFLPPRFGRIYCRTRAAFSPLGGGACGGGGGVGGCDVVPVADGMG